MTVPQGTVPYPQSANAAPLQQAAATYTQIASQLQTMATTITSAVSTAKGGWTGSAANAWGTHLTNRATLISDLAGTVAEVPPALTAMANAITSTSSSYADAVQAEQTARANLPQAIGSLLSALEEESAADVQLQAAGVACAAKMAGIVIDLAEDVASLMVHNVEAAAGQIIPGAINSLIEGLNAVVSVPLPGGYTVRVGVLGAELNSSPTYLALEQDIGAAFTLMESKLHLDADDGSMLTQLQNAGIVAQPTSLDDVGHNLALLEADRRTNGDQSAVILNTIGTNPDGTRNLTVQMGGINPAGGFLPSDSGGRSLGDAAADQITGDGRQEQGVLANIMAQGVNKDDTINLYAHSQGGIVMQNVANDLAAQGYTHVNVVTMGSPETQLDPSVNSWIMQDNSDGVPATRIAGVGGSGILETPNQQVITSDTGLDPLTAHNPQSYAAWSDANPTNPGVQSVNGYLQQLNGSGNLTNVSSNVQILSGYGAPKPDAAGAGPVAPPTVSGTPVTVPAPPTVNLGG